MRNTTESPVKKDEAVIGDGDIAAPKVAMLERVWNTKSRQLFAHSIECWRITAKLFNFQIGEAVVTSHSQARVSASNESVCVWSVSRSRRGQLSPSSSLPRSIHGS